MSKQLYTTLNTGFKMRDFAYYWTSRAFLATPAFPNLWYTRMQYYMSNFKFQNIQRQSASAPGNTISSLPKRDFLDALSKSLPRCDILWHFWTRWGQNQCQTPTTSSWPNYPSKKTVDMSDALFDSLYDSELLNAKGCTQWKIELQFFGKGGSVIVAPIQPIATDWHAR